MSVKMVNDDLKGFINNNSVLAGMKKEPEDNVLEAYFHLAVKRFKPLEHDLALYDRAAEGRRERSYEFLITASRAYLECKRLEKMRFVRSGPKTQLSNSRRPENANVGHHVLTSARKAATKAKERGRARIAVSHVQDHSLHALAKKLASSGRLVTATVAKIAHSSTQKRQSLPRKRTRRKRRRKRTKSRVREVALVVHQALMAPLALRVRGRKVESLLLPMHRQPSASCVRWSWPQWSLKDPPTPSLARWEAWPCRLSSSQTMCTDFDNTENIDSFVKQQIRFDDCPSVFTHAVESSSNMKAVQPRPKKKRKRFTPDRPEYTEAVRVATEDATIAASHLQNAVRNELSSLPAECSYLCNSDIGCVKCFGMRSSTSAPATEIAWIADTGSAHDPVSRHMVSQSSNPVSLLTANGVFQATDQAKVNVPILGADIRPYVVEGSPAVVSVGQRCIDAGWRPYFKKPDGTKVKLEVDDHVPYLPSSTGGAMSAIGQPYMG